MEKYRNLTVDEYLNAFKVLSNEDVTFIMAIYNSPNHTASAKFLADKLSNGKKYQWSNGRVATIGKKISESASVHHPDYIQDINPKGTYTGPTYFMFIGPYYKSEGKVNKTPNGWELMKNLCKAIEINFKITSE